MANQWGRPVAAEIQPLMNRVLRVTTLQGPAVEGTLKGIDRRANLLLWDVAERIPTGPGDRCTVITRKSLYVESKDIKDVTFPSENPSRDGR